jgi:hypothetical protein
MEHTGIIQDFLFQKLPGSPFLNAGRHGGQLQRGHLIKLPYEAVLSSFRARGDSGDADDGAQTAIVRVVLAGAWTPSSIHCVDRRRLIFAVPRGSQSADSSAT